MENALPCSEHPSSVAWTYEVTPAQQQQDLLQVWPKMPAFSTMPRGYRQEDACIGHQGWERTSVVRTEASRSATISQAVGREKGKTGIQHPRADPDWGPGPPPLSKRKGDKYDWGKKGEKNFTTAARKKDDYEMITVWGCVLCAKNVNRSKNFSLFSHTVMDFHGTSAKGY